MGQAKTLTLPDLPTLAIRPGLFHRQDKRKSHFALQRNGFSFVSFLDQSED
jgi:hypothetical protein